MSLRSVDLNLLVALDALLSERHVTKASERVGLSQPAMSNALSRLRGMFGDELLVRTSTGMKATPRAMELAEPLRQLLRQVERVLESDAAFDPSTSERNFSVRMSDILACLILPPLIARKPASSRLAFNVLHLPPADTVEALERDEIDVAISMGLDHSNAIRAEKLMSDRMVCIMRRGHPIDGHDFSLDAFLAQEHMKISMSPTDMRFVDDVLAEIGQQRKIALNVPHWLVVPHVLKQTDLLAVMPGHLAAALMDDQLSMSELPFRSAAFDWMMFWHRRYDQSKANVWLRGLIKQVCSDLSTGNAPATATVGAQQPKQRAQRSRRSLSQGRSRSRSKTTSAAPRT